MYIDDIKLFAKKKWRFGKSNTDSDNIQSSYSNGIWNRKMHHASNEKREKTHDRRNRSTKSRKKSECLEKGKPTKYLGILEADNIKQVEMKEKIFKKEHLNMKASRHKTTL